MKKKLLSIALTAALAFTSLTAFSGCALGDSLKDDEGEKIQSNKTQLYAVTYNGGWGKEWLETMAAEFEEMYKDTSFESGKTGVQIVIKDGKSDVTGDALSAAFQSGSHDIFFTTLNLRQFRLEDKLMDITSVVTNTMDAKYAKVWSDLGETGSIEDKMNPVARDIALYADNKKYTDANGNVNADRSYYGIPMYSSFYNMIYDMDLFYEKGFFLTADSYDANNAPKMDAGNRVINWTVATNGNKSKEALVDSQKSLGQDGVAGTQDDGLPVTLEDFKFLMTRMTENSVTPFTWSGNLDSYRAGFAATLWANYEGANDFRTAVNGEGTDSQFGNITPTNAYQLVRQEGRRQALVFAETIVKGGYYSESSFGGSSHTDAQDNFLQSKYAAATTAGAKRIGMLIEGGWWEHECKATADSMAATYGAEYVNRRFGVLPYPQMDENANKDGMVILATTPYSNVVIRKNAKQTELAKLFLVYTSTEKCMRTYTRMTGSTRAYSYELTDDDKAQMSSYKVSLYEYYMDAVEHNRLIYKVGNTDFAFNNEGIVEGAFNVVSDAIPVLDVSGISDPFRLFYKYPNYTADAYFNALCDAWTETKFNSTFLKYLEVK